MDCQAVRRKIDLYIDGVLSPADSEPFLAHVESCQDCRKELQEMMRLQRALRSLGDLEPPFGLAAAAARKARRRRGMPFAYISVGVAAALAFALVLTNVILPRYARYNRSADQAAPESYMMAAPAEERHSFSDAAGEVSAATEEAPAPVAGNGPEMMATQDGAFTSYAAEYPAEAEEPESDELLQKDQAHIMTAPEPSHIVTVAADDDRQKDIRARLEFIIAEHDIEAFFFSDCTADVISFAVPEAALEDIAALKAELMPEEEIAIGEVIEFRFMK